MPPAAALVTAVLAISWAGPLVRFATAPAIAIAAWRLLFSLALIAVVLLLRRPAFALRRVDFVGIHALEPEALVRLAALEPGVALIDVDSREVV